MEDQQLVFLKRQLCVRLALLVGKLDLENAGRKHFNDSAHLAATQSLIGNVAGESDDIKQLNIVGHDYTMEENSSFRVQNDWSIVARRGQSKQSK